MKTNLKTFNFGKSILNEDTGLSHGLFYPSLPLAQQGLGCAE